MIKSKVLRIRTLNSSFIIFMLFFLSGCMMMGMHKFGRSATSEAAQPVQSESMLIDQLIFNITNDLSKEPQLTIESLAVWYIEARSSSIDTENIRQKIINRLVNNTSYKVVSREHLDKLLTEQSLTLSGIIDSSNANEMGKLIGVEGFVTGYFSKNDDRIELSLKIIQTQNGQVIWSSTQWRDLN